MEKDTFYFSHDYNVRMDVKIKKLIQKHGMIGYGIFWAIVEDLYNNANALPSDYESIAYDLRTDENLVKSVINDFDLFVINNEIISSESVERRLLLRGAKTDAARAAAMIRWEKEREKKREKDANAMQTQCNSNAIKENKEKENKIKKENEKEKIEPLTFAQCIERMKSDEKLKEDQVFINKISLSDYLEYLEIFARTKKTVNERERVDYSDKRQHFINWTGKYKDTFEKNRGKNLPQQQSRPKAKLL